ncbi:MAG TPA: acyl-CoA synthetase [Chloroflexota bacterium]|nr:acyl-CoA synthetase [Chloroflexota bacterium]
MASGDRWPGAPGSIVEAFFTSRDRTPDKPCLVFEGDTFSYTRFGDLVSRWASALAQWGIRRGDRVALFLENSPIFLAAYLGTQLAGGIVVLVNTQYRQVELRHILSDSGARLCVTDAGGVRELERVNADLPDLERTVLAEEAEELLDRPVRAELVEAHGLPSPDDVALIAYTSGTTGRSKGAMLTHANLAANAWAVTTAWRWTSSDSLLLMLPLFHVHGLCVGMHGTWLTGGTAELHRKFDAAVAYDRIASGEITQFFGVPTMYTRLIAEAEKRSESGHLRPAPLRLFVSGSAPLSVQTFEEFERLFGQRILERYGMSETIMNLTNPFAGERRPGTVGMPFPGQEARIVDAVTRDPILDESLGEIQVRGPHVFKGYWQRDDATAEAFDSDRWFNTGDLGWRSADGYYTISGRARELIITGGYNVYPREVEEVLETHPAVAEAAVLGLPDPEFGEQVAAAIVPATGQTVSAEQLVEHCRDQLASYKKPRRVFVMESLPRNALGKIQKHVLREQLEKGVPA